MPIKTLKFTCPDGWALARQLEARAFAERVRINDLMLDLLRDALARRGQDPQSGCDRLADNR